MLILLIPAAIAYQLTIGPIYPDLERVAIVYNLAGAGRRLNAAGIAFLLMWQLVVAASLIGNWKLTRLEPNAAPAEQKSRSRRFAGYLIGSSIVANWLAFIIAFTPAREIAGVLFPLSFILFSIGWLLLLSYLSSLAERVPDHRLARSTARYKRFCLISVLVLVLGVPGVVICGGMAVLALAEIVEVILIAANLSTDASLLIAALVVAGVLALIPLVAVIWGIRLLILYRRSFKLAAQEAQYFWSLEPVDHEAGETETHASSST
jgi:hypothetical protein